MIDSRPLADALATVPLFAGLDADGLESLRREMRVRRFRRGEVIFHQGDPGDALFIVQSGLVKISLPGETGDEAILATLRPGDFFGELALLDGGSRSASAEAVERSVLLVVTRAELLRLLRSEEQVAEALLRALGTMVRRTTRQVTDLVFLNLRGRVARQLLLLAEDGNGAGDITRRVTQGELATMVGGARQTVNQELKSLESSGYIRAAGRAFALLDREQLQRLANQ